MHFSALGEIPGHTARSSSGVMHVPIGRRLKSTLKKRALEPSWEAATVVPSMHAPVIYCSTILSAADFCQTDTAPTVIG